MPNEAIVIDTPEGIAFYALASMKSAVGLELKGLKLSRGVSASALAKQRYGLKGNKQKIYDQLSKMVEDAIAAKHSNAVQQ